MVVFRNLNRRCCRFSLYNLKIMEKQSFREFLHNAVGHPLLAVCNMIGAYTLGTWIHDKLFKF